MLSKAVIDSMRDGFNERFGRLSERSTYLQEAVSDIKSNVCTIPGMKEEQQCTFEDDLYAVISSASMLGYYIGLQEGAGMIQALTSNNLPEMMLEAFGELSHYGGKPL